MGKWFMMVIVFILGIVIGFMACSGDKDFQPGDSFVYGNIEIATYEYPLKGFETSDMFGGILISNKELLFEFLFDDKQELKGVFLSSRKETQDDVTTECVMQYLVSDVDGRSAFINYGGEDYSWHDWNCDGKFDVRCNKTMEDIWIDGKWITISGGDGYGKAIVKEGDKEMYYLFDFNEGKWLMENNEL
ncbi:MAG: hypothetical protein ACYTET_08330 [Planctomycetota bacterium]|jgi:hypothetical protein